MGSMVTPGSGGGEKTEGVAPVVVVPAVVWLIPTLLKYWAWWLDPGVRCGLLP